MKPSTSLHSINADRRLSHSMKAVYLVMNCVNNLFPNLNVDQRLSQKIFVPKNIDKCFPSLHPKSSPSRLLSDLFWRELDWQGMEEKLNKIHVLDIGALLDFALAQSLQQDGCGFLNGLFVVQQAVRGVPEGYRGEEVRDLALQVFAVC